MKSSEHNWANLSETFFVPKCQFLASRPLGCCSFQNILTNPIISQINILLLPYFISYYSSAFTIILISSTTTTPKCTLRSVFFTLCHKTLLNSKSACAVQVVFHGRLIFQISLWPPAAKFSKGTIEPYEGASLMICKACCHPICYHISSHFG